MTSGGGMFSNDFWWGLVSHVGTNKLICEANRWNRSCMMWFLLEGLSKQTTIHYLCGSGKYTTVLCFSIKGGDTRVPDPSPTWRVDGFLE